MKVKKIDLICILLYFAIFKIYLIPTWLQQATKIIAILVVLVFLLTNLSFKKLFNISIPFCFVIIVSGVYAYWNNYILSRGILDSILYAICLYCICSVCIYCSENGYMDNLTNAFYYMTVFYCLASLISIAALGTSNRLAIYYFVGNKFATGYLFIQFSSLFWIRFYEKINISVFWKVLFIFISVLCVLVSRWICCTTSMVAAIFMLVYLLAPASVRKFVQKGKFVLLSIFITTAMVTAFQTIMSIPQVQHIVVDILGEGLNITGREHIYLNAIDIISNNKWLGYGYGNTIVTDVVGYGNIQNGIFQIIVNYGIIGAVIFLGLVYKCSSEQDTGKNDGLYGLLYAMIVASIVEISFDYGFYFALFAIYALSLETNKQERGKKSRAFHLHTDSRRRINHEL